MSNILEIAGWLQSLYNVNSQLLSLFDNLVFNKQKVKDTITLMAELIDIIEQINHIDASVLSPFLGELHYFALTLHDKLKESLLNNDYDFGNLDRRQFESFKTVILHVNDEIYKLLSKLQTLIETDPSQIDKIKIGSNKIDFETFFKVYDEFKKWYSDGAVIDFSQYYPEDFESDFVARDYDDVLKTLHKFKDFIVDFIDKHKFTIFKDTVSMLQRAADEVYTSRELIDYYHDLMSNAGINADDAEFDTNDAYEYVFDEFSRVVQKIETYAQDLNSLMDDVYLLLINQWKQHM